MDIIVYDIALLTNIIFTHLKSKITLCLNSASSLRSVASTRPTT